MTKRTSTHRQITRDDLERGFAAVQDDLRGKVEDRKSTITTIVTVAGVVIVLVVFLLGRRSGKKKTTIVEIRRV